MVVEKGTKSLFEMNEEESANKKIKNTLDFAKDIVNRGKIYIHGEGIPIQYRTLYAGKSKPPFKHGDDM